MAVNFRRFSCWRWRGKKKDHGSNGPSPNSSTEWGLSSREPNITKFPLGTATKKASPTTRVKRKWHSRQQRRVDKEFDVVLVPSDGFCLSGSESDDSDWSIGWLEPHASDFQGDDDAANSFAVLVPCYRRGCKELEEVPKNQLFTAFKNLPDEYSDEGKKYVEQWLFGLQNF